MKRNIIISVLAMLLIFSCKKDVKIDSSKFRVWLNPDVKLEEVLNIKLYSTVLLDDQFKVYYTKNKEEDFNENQVIKIKVKGSENSQIITFKLPKGVIPSKLRLDFGINKKQEFFKVEKIEFNYKDNFFRVPSDLLLKYFEIFDNRLKFESENKKFIVNKSINKKQYLPIIFFKQNLMNQIKDLFAENTSINMLLSEDSKKNLLAINSNQNIKKSIDLVSITNDVLKITGWALLKNTNSNSTESKFYLVNNSKYYILENRKIKRPDVTKFFHAENNYDHSGFEIISNINKIPSGVYKLGIWLSNTIESKEGFLVTDKEIIIE